MLRRNERVWIIYLLELLESLPLTDVRRWEKELMTTS